MAGDRALSHATTEKREREREMHRKRERGERIGRACDTKTDF